MIRKDEGIVLRSFRSGETSRHVTLFARQAGKVKVVAKGALAPKSPLRSVLEPGNIVDFLYYHREGRTLYFLKEASTTRSAGRLRESLPRLAAVLAALEIIDAVCYWASPESRIVDLYAEYEAVCQDVQDPLLLFLAFELGLLEILGLLPDFFSCNVCNAPIEAGYYHPSDGAVACRDHSAQAPDRVAVDAALLALIERIGRGPMQQLAPMEVEAGLRKRLGKMLHWTYTFHIQGYRLPEALKLIQSP